MAGSSTTGPHRTVLVDDEQSDLTKTAEDAPTPIPKDPFTVIIEDASTLEVEEVSMLSVVSIGV